MEMPPEIRIFPDFAFRNRNLPWFFPDFLNSRGKSLGTQENSSFWRFSDFMLESATLLTFFSNNPQCLPVLLPRSWQPHLVVLHWLAGRYWIISFLCARLAVAHWWGTLTASSLFLSLVLNCIFLLTFSDIRSSHSKYIKIFLKCLFNFFLSARYDTLVFHQFNLPMAGSPSKRKYLHRCYLKGWMELSSRC